MYEFLDKICLDSEESIFSSASINIKETQQFLAKLHLKQKKKKNSKEKKRKPIYSKKSAWKEYVNSVALIVYGKKNIIIMMMKTFCEEREAEECFVESGSSLRVPLPAKEGKEAIGER